MNHIIDTLQAETLLQSDTLTDTNAFRTQETVTTLSASTLTLLYSSPMCQVFTGTTAGQIVQLPDARTCSIGHRFEIWNISLATPQIVTIKDASSATLATFPAQSRGWVVLKDNSTLAGIWLVYRSNIATGTGTAATLTFTRNGGVSNAAYLYTGQTLTSFTGYIINGSNYITKLSVSNSSNTGTKNATFRLQQRTSINTFVDIAGTDITIPTSSYSAAVSNILVPIGPDWEISAYRVSNTEDTGATINNIVFSAFTVPQ